MILNANKYSDKKIVWHPDKLEALRTNIVTPPLYVRIKPTNKCCHGCPWCIYNSSYNNTDFQAMGMHNIVNQISVLSRDKMLEILSDLKEMGVNCVTYSGGGEPLIYPHIEEMFRVTKNYGIGLSIITNGQLLDRTKELYDADWVRISMDYCNAKMFAKSRKLSEDKYQQLLNNIANFADKKVPTCDLSINYIITKENYLNIFEAAELLKSLGVNNVRFAPVWTKNHYQYHLLMKQDVLSQLHRAERLETDSFKVYHTYKNFDNADKRSYKKCFIQQIIPAIGADYNVYNCHNKSYTADGIIGNIKEQSFKQMWFSEQTKEHFNTFNAKVCCKCQCANDPKNIFIHELLDCWGDNYV